MPNDHALSESIASMLPAVTQNSPGEPRKQNPMHLKVLKSTWKVWVASFVVWTFIAVMSAFSMYRFNYLFWKPSASFWDELRIPLINDLIFAAFTPIILQISLRYPIERSNWIRRGLQYCAGAIVFAAGHALVRMLVYPVTDSMTKQAYPIGWSLFGRLLLYGLPDICFEVYLPMVAIAHAIWYYLEFRDRELRASQLETRLAQAQLKALKSQLQPHFLFNTLHSISTLMFTNVKAADSMLVRLSDLLRMSLENNTVQETTLNREMQFVNGYLEIEKMRFGDRLEVRCDIAPETLDARVPHLLLQPLVENAIHHGTSRLTRGGELWINSYRRGDDLYLDVGDNGPGFSPKPEWHAKHGLGLNATRERLRVFYGERQRLDIHSAPGRGTIISVQIPFNRGQVPVIYELEAIHGLR